MKLKAVVVLAALAANASALVIVPPTVYFLTLSLSAFLANAVVSLFIFGAFKGVMGKKLWGRSVFEVASSGVSALGTAIVALLAMAGAAYLIQPLDLQSAAACAVCAGVIFLAIKAVLSSKEYIVSGGGRRALAISWLSMAAFVALAAGVSSVLAVEERSISTTGGYYPQQGGGIMQDVVSGFSQAAQAPALNEEGKTLAGGMKEPAVPGANAIASRMWFLPTSQGECIIEVGTFRKAFVPAYSCAVLRDDGKTRMFCPVWVDAAEIGQAGTVAFKATGSCDDAGIVRISDGSFTQIIR